MIQLTIQREFSGHKGSLFAMKANADEAFLYTAGDDKVVAKWHLDKENYAEALLQTPSAIYAMALLEAENCLAVGTRDGTFYLVDTFSKEVKATHRPFTNSVYEMGYDAENGRLWVLYGGGNLCILTVKTGEISHILPIAQENLRSLVFEKEKAFLGASDGNIYILDKNMLSPLRKMAAHDNSVFCLAISPTNKWLFSGGRDAYLNVWDMKNDFVSIEKIPAHNFTLNDIVFSPDNQYFATASRDKSLKIWDADSLALLKVADYARFKSHTHSINRLIWLQKTNILISCGDDRRIIHWKIEK